MCFGGSPKTPDVSTPPTPAPIPSPSASAVSPTQTAEQRAFQVKQLRYGAISTIKNVGGASGITGNGSDFSAVAATGGTKKTLGGS